MNENDFYEDKLKVDSPHFKRLYSQIKLMPSLIEKALILDQTLLVKFKNIRNSAEAVIEELTEKKEEIVKKFNGLPVAKEILEDLSKDVINLKNNLDETLQNLQETTKKDWIEHAKSWIKLYSWWQDQKQIVDAVIQKMNDKNSALIDRDIKVINDYQNQSLAYLSPKSEEFKKVEEKLKRILNKPIENLMKLKEKPKNLSVAQATDWIKNLQKERETYFDEVLKKIDTVIKDVVNMDEINMDPDFLHEMENEISFMEKELHHINEIIPKLDVNDPKDINFIETRLDGLKEHLNDLLLTNPPLSFKKKFEKLQNMINVSSFRIKGI